MLRIAWRFKSANLLALLLVSATLYGQSAAPANPSPPQQSGSTANPHGNPGIATKPTGNESGELESVLEQLDTAADGFHSTQADFVWQQYQKVVDETDVQKGSIYFVRDRKGTQKGTQMAAEITEPDKKYVVFSDGTLRLYQPRIEQLTEYTAGKNREELESFLVLGFGSRGHDLLKAFDVKFNDYETLEGTRVAKMQLAPKSQRVRNIFESVVLWIDPVRGVSLKQQFFEPSGDYRIATYKNFKLNNKVPADTFKLKITSKTKIIQPQ